MNIKLIFRNLKQNFKDYLIYFLTLMLAVSLFYAFNAATSAKALNSMGSDMASMMQTLNSMTEVFSVVIAVLLGFLILYVNQFLLKRRKKELGVYMLLGMKKSKISMLFVGETFCIGLVSLVAGIVLGMFLGQILTVAALRLFGGEVMNFTLDFSAHALGLTVICFGIIYGITMLFNVRAVAGVKLLDLLTAERKNEELKERKSVVYIVTFFLGVLALLSGAVCLKTEEFLPQKSQMLQGGLLIVIATVLIFYSISSVALLLAKKKESFYYKNINSFLVRQLGSRMQGSFLSITAVCFLLTLTILLVTVGVSIAMTMAETTETSAPYDVIVSYDSQKEKDISVIEAAKADENGVDLSTVLKDSVQYPARKATDLTYQDVLGKDAELWLHDIKNGLMEKKVSIIGVSDFNRLLALQGKEELSLKEDAFYFNCNYKGTMEYVKKYMENCKEVTVNGTKLRPMQSQILSETYEMCFVGEDDRGTLVVPDAVAEKGDISYYVLEGQWKEGIDAYETGVEVRGLMGEDIRHAKFGVITKLNIRTSFYSVFGMPVFLCTYIGLIFLLISVALLAVQQLTEVSDNRKRYLILEKQGVTQQMMRSTIRKQVGVYFLAPFLLAAVYTFCALQVILKKISTFYNMKIGAHIVLPLVITLVVYGGYYVATFCSCEKIIFGKKRA